MTKERRPPSPIKLLFQVIQTLHHLVNLQEEGTARQAFSGWAKRMTLTKFMIPLCSVTRRSVVEVAAQDFANSLANSSAAALKDRLDEILGALKAHNISDEDLPNMIKKAKEWASRNFGKKLKEATLCQFDNIIRSILKPKNDLATPDDLTTGGTLAAGRERGAPPVPAPRKRNSQRSSTPPTTTKTPKRSDPIVSNNRFSVLASLLPETDRTLGSGQSASPRPTPRKRGRSELGTPDSSPTSTQAPKRLNTNIVIDSLSKLDGNVDASPKTSPVTQRRQGQGSPTSYSEAVRGSPPANKSSISPTRNRVIRFNKLKRDQRGHPDFSSWEIPKINTDVLVLGDSNLSRVSWVGQSGAQVLSYPGLKLSSLLRLLKGFRHGNGSPNPGRIPSKIVFSVGINDRGLSPQTNSVQLRKVVNEALHIFPNSRIYLANIQYCQALSRQEKDTISILNDDMKSLASTKKDVLTIPALPKAKFNVGHDNIHWTENCANATLNHYFNHLN